MAFNPSFQVATMLKEIVFCGVDSVPHLKRRASTAIVSILDKSESSTRPDLSEFGASIALEFEDSYEELHGLQGNFFGLMPDEQMSAKYCWHKGEALFDLNHARQIVEFVRKVHFECPAIRCLAVHCYAGVSRSAAVASFFALKYGVGLNTNASTEFANPRVLRVLEYAFNEDKGI